jgi:multiple sugar transport system ATP-binding protein
VILGIRPEDFEDASLVPDVPEDRRFSTKVDLIEALGSEVLAHFTINAPIVLTEDTKELAADVGTEAVESLEQLAQQDRSVFVSRLNPATKAREGEKIELTVDTGRLHVFDPETGRGIYDGD